jgi:hypothetical protein
LFIHLFYCPSCFLFAYTTLNLECIFICQGENPKKPGAPHNVRLYSIASTRYGDNFDGRTGSLCVRRAVYYDPETGKEDPSKNGVCSNFLCNAKPGDKIQLTGNFLMDVKALLCVYLPDCLL